MRNLILTLIIWIICFTAITIGVSLTYKWYRNLGIDIQISFNDVSGLVPNQSKIMYRGAEIGTVEAIDLNIQTGYPIVKARVRKQSKSLLANDSLFWIVRPEFALGSINNLSTIATGDYIALHPGSGKFVNEFVGLEDAPVEDKFNYGLKLLLRANSTAGIEIGSGVLYKDFQIGQVGEMGLSEDKKYVLITIYIDKQYTSVIRRNSYFGNISGFYADIHIFGGSKIALDSLRTLINGGIKVVTPNLNGPAVKNGCIFNMLSREQIAELEGN